MKKTLLVIALAMCSPGTLISAHNHYLREAITEGNLEAVKEGLYRVGTLDTEEKKELRDLAHTMVMRTKTISMDHWDWVKMIGGGCCFFYNAYIFYVMSLFHTFGAPVVSAFSPEVGNDVKKELKTYMFLNVLGAGAGAWLMRNASQCNASQTRLQNAQKIESAIQAAPAA